MTPPVRKLLRYQHVIALVERLISEGGLVAGSMLPTQRELAAQAGVSLITVRRALEELESAGRVTSHQGVGTFVAHARVVSEPARSGGLLATLAAQAERHAVVTQLLELRTTPAPATIASLLRVAGGQPVWRIRRLRRIDGEPKVLEHAHVPVFLAPDLARHSARLEQSLYALLAAEYGMVDDYEEQLLSVGVAGEDERRLLKLKPRAQIVRLRGTSFTRDDVPFDSFEQVYPAWEFVFSISGRTSRQLLRAEEARDGTSEEDQQR